MTQKTAAFSSSRHAFLSSVGSIVVCLLPLSAAAQDTGGALYDEDVIIVTAQKRAQSTLDVGINIAVVDAQTIAEQRIDDVTDIVSITPNVSIKENVPGLVPVVTIRGVGLNDFSATNNPSAGIYVDEVSLSSLALMNFDLFDLERMEVLKGPQGTLYGRTATAGALNIVTARPNFDGVSGRLAGTYGNYETSEIDGMINVPLGETASMRLAGKGIFQDEGFFFNERLGRDIGRRDVLLGRAQILFQPTDQFDLLLKSEVQRGRSELGGGEFFGAASTPLTPPGVVCPGQPECSDFFGYSDLDGDPYTGSYSVDPDYDFDQLNLTAIANLDLGFGTLTSVTGFIDFDRQWAADTDAGPLNQLDFYASDDVEQFSQEVRIAGENGPATWLVGAFYSKDDIVTIFDGDVEALLNTSLSTTSDQESKSTAIFANVEWSLSDEFSLITGIRYTDEERSNVGGTSDLVSLPPASFLTFAPVGTGPIPLSVSDETIEDTNWSWKLGLNWKPAADLLVYASATQSWKSGGFFAGVAFDSAQLAPYRPERIISYEAGVKGSLASADLTYGVSAFYYDYNDVQTFIREDIGGIPVQRLGNVDEAEIYGVDIDLAWRPSAIDGLTLTAGIGLLETELGSFLSGNGPVPSGNELPDAPGLSFNGGASYQFAVSETLESKLSVNARHQSDAFKDAINDELIAADSFWVMDARASIFAKNDWDVSLWAKNLTDEEYITAGANQLPFGMGFRVYGPPRTYGITLTKHFN